MNVYMLQAHAIINLPSFYSPSNHQKYWNLYFSVVAVGQVSLEVVRYFMCFKLYLKEQMDEENDHQK